MFTSAVRREGGFFKASLKEVSMAPVIFITSASDPHRSLSQATSLSSSPRRLFSWTHSHPSGSCPRRAEHGWSLFPKKKEKKKKKGDRLGELRLLQEREANFSSTHCAAEKQRRVVKCNRKVGLWDMPCRILFIFGRRKYPPR